MNRLLDPAERPYYLWKTLYWLANVLPPALGERLFRLLGALTYRFAKDTREAAIDNFRHVLGPQASPAEVEATARAALIYQLYRYYTLLRPHMDDAEWARRHTVEGWEHFDAVVQPDKPAIIMVAHFGILEHLAEAVRRDRGGLRPLTPAEALKPPRLFDLIMGLREGFGGRGIPADTSAMEMVRRLRRGETVAIAVDYDSTRTGVIVDFFGAPALMPQGPARLALLAGAPIIPGYSRQLPDGSFHTVFEPAIIVERTGEREADTIAGTMQITAVLERWISARPSEWTMFNPIWRWAAEAKGDESGAA